MSRAKSSRRTGRIIFFIPIVVVLAIVLLAFVSFLTVQSGTLEVMAQSSGRYSPSVSLHPYVSIGSTTQVAPFNLSLAQSQYTVVFGPLSWYKTPAPKTLVLSLGKTEFAVGVYSPIMRGIAVSQNGFNSSSVTALHGVTPIVWINVGTLPVSIEVSNGGRVLLNPSQNYTAIFSSTGTFSFDIPNSGFSGTVQSK
jgi:hypothetical protein